MFFCFKQLSLTINKKFEFSDHLIDEVVIFLAEKPLDFHNAIFFNRAVEVLNNVLLHQY